MNVINMPNYTNKLTLKRKNIFPLWEHKTQTKVARHSKKTSYFHMAETSTRFQVGLQIVGPRIFQRLAIVSFPLLRLPQMQWHPALPHGSKMPGKASTFASLFYIFQEEKSKNFLKASGEKKRMLPPRI